MIAAGVYAGDAQEGMRVLQPLREFGKPLGEIAGAIPYRAFQSAFDASLPNTGEVIAYWKSLYLDDLTDAAIEIMADRGGESQLALDDGIRPAPRRRRAARAAGRDGLSLPATPPSSLNFMGDWRDRK